MGSTNRTGLGIEKKKKKKKKLEIKFSYRLYCTMMFKSSLDSIFLLYKKSQFITSSIVVVINWPFLYNRKMLSKLFLNIMVQYRRYENFISIFFYFFFFQFPNPFGSLIPFLSSKRRKSYLYNYQKAGYVLITSFKFAFIDTRAL